jgi:hypothetical protein
MLITSIKRRPEVIIDEIFIDTIRKNKDKMEN